MRVMRLVSRHTLWPASARICIPGPLVHSGVIQNAMSSKRKSVEFSAVPEKKAKPAPAQAAVSSAAALVGAAAIYPRSSVLRAAAAKLAADFDAKVRQHPGVVLAFGSNECLQLGLGDEITERKKPGVVQAFAGHNVVDIACGGIHNAAVTADGRVWTWGCNDEKALGREFDEGQEWQPAPVGGLLTGQRVVQVVCGDSHTTVLTADGQCYNWGTYRDLAGILGFSSGVDKQVLPAHIAELAADCVVQIAAGENTDMALTSTGDVFEWGNTRIAAAVPARHKLGRLAPSRVLFPRGAKIARLFAGIATNFALTTGGDVYAWGLNNFSQTGLDRAEVGEKIARPVLVPALSQCGVRSIATGLFHTLALLGDGAQARVLSCGSGIYGQLGHGNKNESTAFAEIAALKGKNIARVACGTQHSLAVTTDGRVYAWGFGEMLQLGNGVEQDELVPTLVEGQQLETRVVLKAHAGGQHTVFLAEEK